jgi:cytochrome c553
MKKINIIIIIICMASFIACKKKTVYDCTGVTSTYTSNVKPIIDAKCATSGCHNDISKADGFDFSNYGQIKTHTTHASFLGSIEHAKGYAAMPQNGSKLSDAEIKLIACWIQNGSPQ